MQNPWKHWATGDAATARSARTVSSLGTRLKIKKSVRSTVSNRRPKIRRFFAPLSYKVCGKSLLRIFDPRLGRHRLYDHLLKVVNRDTKCSFFLRNAVQPMR